MIAQPPTASLLVLLTCRPSLHPAWHHRASITAMTVHHLAHTQVAQMVAGMPAGTAFPPAVRQQSIAKTDGVPLLVEERTKASLASEHLKEVAEPYACTGALRTLPIPATLHDSLLARLDRLMTAQVIAQRGATVGRQFADALLQAVAQLEEARLQHELGRLGEAEIVEQRGLPPPAYYFFKPALMQDTAYESFFQSPRQQ